MSAICDSVAPLASAKPARLVTASAASSGATTDMGEEGGQCAGSDAFDTGRLTEGQGANGGKLLAHLTGEAADNRIVEGRVELQVLVTPERRDVCRLTIQITGIGSVDLQLLA